ncbi:MAG TPA: ABC transporter permease subunit [Stellaceae bacterium]|nr:ABC transporter permease subunit [Stellaceae bacterium]
MARVTSGAFVQRPEISRGARLLPRLDLGKCMIALALLPALIIIALLLGTFWISFRESLLGPALTLQHYVELSSDPFAYRALLNSLGFALYTLIVAFAFGVPIAWLAERTDIRGKSAIYALMTLGIFIPSFFSAMGWLFVLHPRIGMVNVWLRGLFGLSEAPFSIINLPGMGLVQGLGLASVVFVLTAASLRSMDSYLEEAAQMCGARFGSTLRHVLLPLAWPGLLASGLYVFTIAIGAFDVPLVIGMSNRIYTFSTYLYVMANPLNGEPRYGLIAAFASFMVVIALLLSWWYSRILLQSRRYQIVSGKAYRPRLTALGGWRFLAWGFIAFFFLIGKLLPLAMMIWASLLPYFQPFSAKALAVLSFNNYTHLNWPLLLRGLMNTAILMVSVPALALAMSLIFSWVVLRTRSRFRIVFDFVAFLPHAVPSTIFAFVALVFALALSGGAFDLSGSLLLIVIVMAIVMLSFGSRITNSALIQIHTELEEAASMAGASLLVTLRRIIIPLLLPALLFGWLWIALLTFREMTIPMILFSASNVTYSVAIWGLWYGGSFDAAAAANLLMIALLLPLVFLYLRYARKTGTGPM